MSDLPGQIPVEMTDVEAARFMGLHWSTLKSYQLRGIAPVRYTEADIMRWWEPPTHLASLALRPGRIIGMVYFLQDADEQGPVKVGWTINLETRLRDIQACSPVPLEYIGGTSGSKYLEQAIHKHFADYRLHNEWFLPIPALTKLARELSRGTAPIVEAAHA